MRLEAVRSGIAETEYDTIVCAVTATENVLTSSGDIDRPLFYRSTIKPFQATAVIESGVRLPPEHLALACASHGGTPAHVAIVREMLATEGIPESALLCPADDPMAPAARVRRAARGATRPLPILHNCSGKHAGVLRACAARGWPQATYLDPEHPMQRRIVTIVEDVTGVDATPTGLDGCGFPTLRGSVRGLALGYARLTADARFHDVATAMARFPALVADNTRPDGRLGMWWGGPVKAGASGLVAMSRNGLGIAAKSLSGSIDIAVVAAIETASRLGVLSRAALDELADVAQPPVVGAGQRVGSLAPVAR